MSKLGHNFGQKYGHNESLTKKKKLLNDLVQKK